MLLLIDAGNSYLKWNTASEKRKQLLGTTCRVDWRSRRSMDRMMAQWLERNDISRVIMSSVVDEDRNNTINQWVKGNYQIDLEFVESQRSAFGVNNAYRNPAQMGVDRWVALVGCAALFIKESCIVVDCGTAITIDALLANGTHKGGVIFPGVQLMKNSLLRNTDIQSKAANNGKQHNKDIEIFNQTTETSIQNGVLNTIVAGIISTVTAMQKSSKQMQVIVTGGNAPDLLPHMPDQYRHEPDLIMEGLLAMAVNP